MELLDIIVTKNNIQFAFTKIDIMVDKVKATQPHKVDFIDEWSTISNILKESCFSFHQLHNESIVIYARNKFLEIEYLKQRQEIEELRKQNKNLMDGI